MFATRRERRDRSWQRWLQSLEQPFDLVPGAEAGAAFEAAWTKSRGQGFTPLIIQPGFDAPVRAGPAPFDRDFDGAADEYFASRTRALAEAAEEFALFDDIPEVAPGPAQSLSMTDLLSQTRPLSPYHEVAILRLPCAESWKIPLFLHIGGPADETERDTAEEIDLQRQWFERFGAELCCVGERVWQFRVAHPPRNHRDAVELLRQHYLYAWVDDAYDQEIIEQSAAQLRVDTHWMFNWV